MTDIRQFLDYFRKRFIEERINTKNSWGKNEILQAWNETLLDAVLDYREETGKGV